MRQFSKEDRKEIEEIIITFVRDYDHQGIMKNLISHGIDSSKYFSDKDFRLIYKICLEMYEQKIIIDIRTFYDFCDKRMKANIHLQNAYNKFVSLSVPRFPSVVSFDYYCFLFKEHLIVDFWNHCFQKFLDEKPPNQDVIEGSFYIRDGFDELWKKFTKNYVESDGELSLKEQAVQQRINMLNGIATSVKTGLRKLDEFTGGFEDTELYLLAARPAMGKTTFSVGLAKRFISQGKRVHFFTLEMIKKQIVNKFVADDLNLEYKDLKRGLISDAEFPLVLERYDYYENNPYLIVDSLPSRTLSDFKDKIDKIESDIIIIDYLQLMVVDPSITSKKSINREQEVGTISNNLKKFAKEVKRPIIALSQLSRAVENRKGNRPQLQDLRESGSLEQDADVIMFLYREAYYQDLNGIPVPKIQQGNTELIFAKGREIGTGMLEFWLDFKRNKIEEDFKY